MNTKQQQTETKKPREYIYEIKSIQSNVNVKGMSWNIYKYKQKLHVSKGTVVSNQWQTFNASHSHSPSDDDIIFK